MANDMKNITIIFLLSLTILFSPLSSYESESKLEVVIIGKAAKFIKWEEDKSDNFIITVLSNPYGSLFDEIFKGKKVKNKDIKVVYIDTIDELQHSHVLYIPTSKKNELPDILNKVKNKNILTVSSIRGFAQKQGILQIYFVAQKVKLKINLDVAKNEDLHINSTLLRISEVVGHK